MKAVLLIFILLLSGCKSSQNEPEEFGFGAEKEKRFIENIDENENSEIDCLYIQSIQTDEFLKDIKELEGYFWDNKTKAAKLFIEDHILEITKGGCNQFEFSATFIYPGILDIEKDRKLIFDDIKWITSLLNDFDGELIKEVIDNNKFSITKEDNYNFYFNFMDERLYELYFMNFNNKDFTTFNIGYILY